MPPKIAPLDEQMFEAPELFVMHDLPGHSLNTDSILWYFMNSQFFDGSSNNVALFNQVRGDMSNPILQSRKAFEEALQTRFPLGLQFVVAAEPQNPGEPWVIQKQVKKRAVDKDGRQLDRVEVEVLASYYTVGNRILMAPSLLDVLQSRLLSTSMYLQDLFDLSSNLSHYSPATGHTYMPPSYEAATKTTTASRLGSPGLVAVEVEAPASQPTSSQGPVALETSATEFSDDFFLESLTATNKYGHEFMDENPLQGEPGSFVYGNTTRQVEARNKAAAAAAASGASSLTVSTSQVPKAGDVESALNSAAPTPKAAATPKAAPTPLPTETGSRKGSVASVPRLSKANRRKSKGLASPITPTASSGPP
ncbi:hypothetical protein K504DRAFT_466013 [Pleomassaria siparia CBS 279.74]|uniref:Mediator of RNA polymerase II transcription subunit 6 n=1 Tax=Pleomassaria siparia CBS 279.74 TaxID=1314801 RepID=A0A6G1KDR4_9PLEO|nr:hypothetical protein K504DRAFT_466013 [Pleomassaria siparia CBS 279.74]